MTEEEMKLVKERSATIIAERDKTLVSLIESLSEYLLTGSGNYEDAAQRLAVLNQTIEYLPMTMDCLKKRD
ncbi:hypothetical protein JXO59_12385 [candidate division KSB1 bacterium]|nr:hypothetical protein [candidate division KSB1 bacterium]